jgi:hypothetical protein
MPKDAVVWCCWCGVLLLEILPLVVWWKFSGSPG